MPTPSACSPRISRARRGESRPRRRDRPYAILAAEPRRATRARSRPTTRRLRRPARAHAQALPGARGCPRPLASAAATSSSTSSRTPTPSSTASSRCWPPPGNLTVVATTTESIYGWRGALPGNILDFTRDWRRRRSSRSTRTTAPPATSWRRRTPSSAGTRAAREEPLERPRRRRAGRVLACKDSEDEANAVVERNHRAGRLRQGPAVDCAVIFRTNAQSRPFEDVLRRHRCATS